MTKVARDIMQEASVRLRTDMDLAEAGEMLRAYDVTGAPVLSADDELVGVFSIKDLVSVTLSLVVDEDISFDSLAETSSLPSRLKGRKVADIMDTKLFTVQPDDRVSHLAQQMRQHRIHRLIVVESGKVVGIVTTLDMIGLLE